MKKFLATLVVAAVVLGATASPAEALFRLRIEDVTSGIGVVISDDGAGDLAGGMPNIIVFSGTVGAFNVNVSTGTKTPLLIAPGMYDAIDLNDLSITATGGTIRLILEADGFTTAPDGGVGLHTSVGGVLAGSPGSTATFTGYANPGNLVPTFGLDTFPAAALPAIPDLPPAGSAVAGPLVFGPGAFSGEASSGFIKAGAYSLFSSAVITFVGPGSISFDHMTGTTPAPAGLVLLAAGAPFLALGYYRRKKAAVKA